MRAGCWGGSWELQDQGLERGAWASLLMGIGEAITVNKEETDEEKEGLCCPKEGHN